LPHLLPLCMRLFGFASTVPGVVPGVSRTWEHLLKRACAAPRVSTATFPPHSLKCTSHFCTSLSQPPQHNIINALTRPGGIKLFATSPFPNRPRPTCAQERGSHKARCRHSSASQLDSQVCAEMTATNGTEALNSLIHKADMFGGVIIDPEALPGCSDEFGSRLRISLRMWREEQKRGVWLKVPTSLSTHIPVAVKEGFEFHHAEAGYVMMTQWLSAAESTLPNNASHQIGVGALVVNDKDEVLVVQEALGPTAARKDFWKMPTGMMNCGEEIHDAVVREVEEETGIKTEFLSIISFRSVHDVGMANKSDLFFVCALRPLTHDITIQETELKAAKWMPVADWLAMETMRGSLYKQLYHWGLDAIRGGGYKGFVAKELPIGFRPGTNVVYHLDGAEATAIAGEYDSAPPTKKPKL